MTQKNELKILCPFCSAPYTAKMLWDIEEYGAGCATCGPESADIKLEIVCSNCKKIVYKVEGKSDDIIFSKYHQHLQ